MFFREVNRGKCKTYLVACERTRAAALLDPVRDRVDLYVALLAYHGYRLEYAVDTHTHADHRTGGPDLKALLGCRLVMHRRAPAPGVDVHLEDGDELRIGDVVLAALSTPGHTPDGQSLFGEDRVFTGDTLLIRGTGRSDFAGGDAGAQYDSITRRLFTLPDDTLVFPAHDYRGNVSSTIGEEKRSNPRVAGRTRAEYVELMSNLGLALPDKIQEVLQPNQSSLDDDRLRFPTLGELNHVRQLLPEHVDLLRMGPFPPVLLDVREPEEYTGELGHIPGTVLVPLKDLPARASELEAHAGTRDRHLPRRGAQHHRGGDPHRPRLRARLEPSGRDGRLERRRARRRALSGPQSASASARSRRAYIDAIVSWSAA
jgi:glyoxylase-like metal-dependent hydrolase (beta-lactamase superfamily II)/rhodanese-related sulfurtransferase